MNVFDDYRYLSSIDGLCKECNYDNGCYRCSDDENAPCSYCKSGYFLFNNKTCIKCTDLFGEGCECDYSLYDGSLYCKYCDNGYILNFDGKCESCNNKEVTGLTGCKVCFSKGNSFYCYECENNYILFEGNCLLINDSDFSRCSELENIGKNGDVLYSCKKCSSGIFAIKENGVKICVYNDYYRELTRCKFAKKEPIGKDNYTCIECEDSKEIVLGYDEYIEKQACLCIEGYSKKYDTKSYYFNCVKDESPCSFSIYQNKCLNCTLVKGIYGQSEKCLLFEEPYFLNNNYKLDHCDNYFDQCVRCYYSDVDTKSNLKCDKCKEGYFINKNGTCELCYINQKVGPYCLLCADYENITESTQCQRCTEDYFLTKDNTCVFCKNEQYGGKNCLECGYINYDGEEKIGCINCMNEYILAEDGNCYYDYNHIEFHCEKFGIYKDKNNNKKYGCLECYSDFCLNENYECVKINLEGCSSSKIINSKEICFACNPGYYLEKEKCKKIKPILDNQKIRGCLLYELFFNIYYCIKCNKNYYKYHGYCYLIPNYPIFKGCKTYNFDSNQIYCQNCIDEDYNERYYRYIYGDMTICSNKFFGNCSSITNIGNKKNPKYSCGKCKYINMTDENGILKCIALDYNQYCLEGMIDTNYFNDLYTCTKCKDKYILSYDDYYETYICKDIFDENNNQINNDKEDYESDTGIETSDGKCVDGYFTRNLKVCIKCDDEINGMPGCGGNCNFMINRKKQLKCEYGKCKNNYFEMEPGICELCNNTLLGCEKCSYINNNQTEIVFPIRKRELICNECQEGFLLKNNECISCKETFPNCNICTIKNNELECIEPNSGYYIDENGKIDECEDFCDKCKVIKDEVKCIEAKYGYYINSEGNIEVCENNCKKCEFVIEEGINKVKCIETILGYFINSDGKVKKCDDEIEGIKNCTSCEYKSNLQCTNCQIGFQVSDNKCKSYKELYNLDGCKNVSKEYNSYYCNECFDDYFYISNERKCALKKEETLYCSKAKLIDKKYNCTQCADYDSLLIKNLDDYYYCYLKNLIKTINDCKIYRNKGTYDDPFFDCDKCDNLRMIIITDDEKQICYKLYSKYCNKGKIYLDKIQNKEIFQCVECYPDYNLVFNNITNITSCVYKYIVDDDPTENTENKTDIIEPFKCEIEKCIKCNQSNIKICDQCETGYIVNKLGNCFIKPKEIPEIIFKDIFRYSLNGMNDLNGNKIFKFEFYLRGITTNDITSKHSFIISTIFAIKNKLRYLEDNKNLKTNCEYQKLSSNSNNILKYADYKCVSENINQDLSEYQINNIYEGQYEDKENLKSYNLTNLISTINDITKSESIFNENEINKYIIFIVNNSSKKIKINKSDFNIIIYGKINKEITKKILGSVHFSNIKNKNIECEINGYDKNNASLLIKSNISDILLNSQPNKLSINMKEIISDNNNVFFIGLDEVEITILSENNNKSNYKNLWFFILLAVIGIIFILIIIVVLYNKYSRNKWKKIIEENNDEKLGNIL